MTLAEEYALEWRRNLDNEINRKNPHGPQRGAKTGWDVQVICYKDDEWRGNADYSGLFIRENDAYIETWRYAVHGLHGCAIRIVHYEDGVPDKVVMSSDRRTLGQKWRMRGRNDPKPLMSDEDHLEAARRIGDEIRAAMEDG